jgi:hypothetical protein
LRHQYAAETFEDLTGFATPVSGAMPLVITPEIRAADLQARRDVSRLLGHFRDDVTKSYIGSIQLMSRERTKRISDWVNLTEGNIRFQEVLQRYGIEKAWMGGRFASGLEVTPAERIRLYVKASGRLPDDGLDGLHANLSQAVSRGVDISEHIKDCAPEDCLEIFVRPVREVA